MFSCATKTLPYKKKYTGNYVTQNCTENGSCYGDISTTTGRPKTAYLKGYYKKYGSYIRGYY